MWIKRLNIVAFGKLKNLEIDLEQGFNIVKGDNESGKTTLFYFIYACLFDMKRLRGRASANDLYSRYKPWDAPGSYGGSLEFVHDRKTYRLERVFLSSERSVKLICLDTGREIPMPTGTITDLIPGLTEEIYKNTMCIGPWGTDTEAGFSQEAAGLMSEEGLRSSNSADVKSALDKLSARRKELVKGIAACDTQPLTAAFAENERVLSERVRLEGVIASYEEELAESGKKVEKLHSVLSEVRRTLKEYTDEVVQKDVSSQSGRMAVNGQGPECDSDTDSTSVAGEKSAKKSALLSRLSYVFILLGLVFCVIGNDRSLVFLVAGIICVIAGVFCFSADFLKKKESVGRARTKEGAFAGEAAGATAGQSTDAAAAANSGQSTDEAGRADMADKLNLDIAKLEAELNAARADELACRSSLREVEREYYSLQGGERTASEYRADIRQLKNRAEELGLELEAVDLAISTLREVEESLGTMYAGRITRLASGLTDEMTAGVYRDILIDEGLKVSVKDGTGYHPASSLSTGARDQVNIAYRLSVADILLEGMNVPLILDEVFDHCDDRRLAAALDMLLEKYDNQVVLFSCHDREKDMLKEAANVIAL